jgi:hypothetical protein
VLSGGSGLYMDERIAEAVLIAIDEKTIDLDDE